jgi:hypothetical protein
MELSCGTGRKPPKSLLIAHDCAALPKAHKEAVASLSELPRRCPLAPESVEFPFEVRQLLTTQRKRRRANEIDFRSLPWAQGVVGSNPIARPITSCPYPWLEA